MLSDVLQYILCIARICPWHRTQSNPHSGASSSAGNTLCNTLCGAVRWALAGVSELSRLPAELPALAVVLDPGPLVVHHLV
jgi:hypothetical protein